MRSYAGGRAAKPAGVGRLMIVSHKSGIAAATCEEPYLRLLSLRSSKIPSGVIS